MSDVLDILDVERPNTPEVSKETILGTDARKNKHMQKRKLIEATFKRPEGMHRELYALLFSDARDNPPLLPTDSSQGYKRNKAKLGIRRVRPWRWMPFTNPARKDGVMLSHWRRVADEGKDYPFAKFNKQVPVPSYSEVEYQQHLTSTQWSRAETDHLLELCRRFDQRFLIVRDRWDTTRFSTVRSVEDLKERYYGICQTLARVRAPPGQEPKGRAFDADHERRRKEQLLKLYDRTSEQVEEEQTLLGELRKIELRKKEREKKTQDLQKLITAADNSAEARRVERKGPKKKLSVQKSSRIEPGAVESAGIRFPDFKACGVSLRSHRMKLPASVGQKKTKAIEQLLQELGVELNPTPSEEVAQHFNELRSDMVLLYELKLALATCEYELQTLRHQFEVLAPDRAAATAAATGAAAALLATGSGALAAGSSTGGSATAPSATATDPGATADTPVRGISEILDVGATPGTPNRKRRAAIEQSNLLKKFKKA
ncbi:DNA methyltransferase 1 associated protein 1 [Haemaphysalis longicornis]